jgi:uncharacterized membrane protein YkvA (DUF1232 family)
MTRPSAATPTDRWRTVRFLIHLPRLIRLYWRLLWDARVPAWLKVMLLGAVAYVVFPFDLIPDVVPVLGEIDDLVVLIVAARWFLEWCPPTVVAEHVRALRG